MPSAAPSPPAPALFKAPSLLISHLSNNSAASDFDHAPSSPARSLADVEASRAKLQLGGVVASTAAVGFLEACLHFERRPIPLRFALRYALSNVLPSAVWATAPAELVAAASGVSTSGLITASSSSSSSLSLSASQARARQLLVLKSARSVRHALGSYVLAWSLYRVYAASDGGAASSGEEGDGEPAVFEKVVRLAPEGSALSSVSRTRHGDHITTLPLSAGASRKPHPSALAIDWDAQGLLPTGSPPIKDAKLRLVEVEVRDDESLKNARRVIKKAVYDLPDELLQTVAVLPAHDAIAPSALEDFDVRVSPLAVALRALAAACEVQEVASGLVFLVCADDPNDAVVGTELSTSSGIGYSALSRGLLYQHGIQVTRATDTSALVSKLIESGFVSSDSVYVVCEESNTAAHRGNSISSVLPTILQHHLRTNNISNNSSSSSSVDATHILSLADISDELLQSVRKALRDGHSAAAVQRAIYATYGPQQALFVRKDAFSDVSRSYI